MDTDPVTRKVQAILEEVQPFPQGAQLERARTLAKNALFGQVQTTKVGRYTVLERLGAGASGVVYSAYDPELDRGVALKVLHRAVPGGRFDRGLREARAGAKVVHPNIVAVYEVGRHGDETYIAMQLIDGGSLRWWLQQAERTTDEIAAVLLQAGRGLAAAHDENLIHRDFKPDNILVDRRGTAFVADFGLARLVAEPTAPPALATSTTSDGAGTPVYMSPEQLGGAPATVASDEYAFCFTAFEALTGTRPFSTDHLSRRRKLGGQIDGKAAARLPARWRRALLRGLSTDPKERWGSMHALLACLAPSRLRRPAYVAATVAAGLAIYAAMPGQGSRLVQCENDGDAFARVWNPERAAAVASALRRRGEPSPERTATAVGEAVDDYASRWRAAQVEVCVRDGAAQDWTAAMSERASRCLESRRTEVNTVLTLFEDAPPGGAHQTLRVVMTLPSPQACLDRTQLLRQQATTTGDPWARQHALQRDVLRQALLRDAGRYAAALDLAVVNRARAHTLGDPSIEVGALRGLAASLADIGRVSDVGAVLDEALVLAWQTGDDRALAMLATDLAFHEGVRLARGASGERWLALARASVARAPDDLELQLRQLEVSTALAESQSRGSERVAFAQKTVELAAQIYGAQHPVTGDAWLAAADAHSDVRQDGLAVDAAGRALAIYESSLGADAPATAHATAALARAYWDADRFEESLEPRKIAQELNAAHLEQGGLAAAETSMVLARLLLREGLAGDAEALATAAGAAYERAYGRSHPHFAEVQRLLSAIFRRDGRFFAARSAIESALATVRSTLGPMHPRVAELLSELAAIHNARDDHDEAVRAQARAVTIFNAHDPSRDRRYAERIDRLAEYHAEARNFEEALALYAEVESVYRERLGARAGRVGVALHNQAWVLGKAKLWRRALPLAKAAVEIREEGEPDQRGVISSLAEVGRIYGGLGELTAMDQSVTEALAMVDDAYPPDDAERPVVMLQFARLFVGHDPTRAIELAQEAVAQSRPPAPPSYTLAEGLKLIARAYAAMGDPAAAADHAAQAIPVYAHFGKQATVEELRAEIARWKKDSLRPRRGSLR